MKTKLDFEKAVDYLIEAAPRNNNKGKLVKEWFSKEFNCSIGISHITEDKAKGNRVKEQFNSDPIVVFVCNETNVTINKITDYIKRYYYDKLETVLLLTDVKPYKYLHLYEFVKNPFSEWASKEFNISPENLIISEDEIEHNIEFESGNSVDSSDMHRKKDEDQTKEKPLQQIFYGAPGTGKSYAVNKRVKDILKGMSEEEREKHKFRTTFHPDSDYASFVGCYKPMKEKTSSQLSNSNNKDNGNMTEADLITELQAAINSTNNSKTYNWYRFGIDYYKSLNKYLEVKGNNLHNLVNKAMNFGKTPFSQDTFIKAGMQICEDILLIGSSESKITYSFVPQSFTNAYVAAWNDLGNSYFLIIEEINRGNCAQVFGDLFQLLDRKDDGTSDYTIKADNDLRDYLEENLTNKDGIKNGELCLPPNLYIWATMNTSDQSLFPMDSAFKRRWDWEYMPICYDKTTQDGKENKAYDFTITINKNREYSWINFLRVVNLLVKDATDSEDKQMGNFFIKHNVEEKEFISKVMYYLWSEVCKDNFGSRQNFFRDKDDKEFSFNELFDDKDHAILISFMKRLQKEADVRDELKDKGIVIEKDVPAKEKKEEPIDTQEESE